MTTPIEKFAAQGSAARLQSFGKPITFNRAGSNTPLTLTVLYSGVTDKRQLTDGGFIYEHDFICRIPKAAINFTPTLKDTITIGSKTYRVAELVDHPINPEYRLGLSAKI